MNEAQFTGALGRDATVNYTNNGTAVCNFPIGVTVGFGQNQSTLWVQCSLFGKRAEGQLPQYLQKGVKVAVSGEVNKAEWQSQNGPRSAVTLNVSSLDLMSHPQQQNNQPPQNQGQPQGQGNPNQGPPQTGPGYGGPQQGQTAPQPDPTDDFDDDIPF